ncbi:unnamed protein product [Rotaria magnacalcarata]|uniref:Uncharacterized protein n=1 Tax=Rotaria magnacalcarata TaxID=392030 RepID=A0A816NQR2_9BILA|nr:unnamed protein product [Rotaria magnacalcarata]
MQDILDLVEISDEKGVKLPKFVADSYDALPPTSGFGIIGDTIMSLMDEVSKLREEIKTLRDMRLSENSSMEDNVSIKETLLEIQLELTAMRKSTSNVSRSKKEETCEL